MAGKITVIGSANADLVIHSDKMPELGETLNGSHFQINAGGKGLNQAVAIAKLGGNVSFLGAVGNDANGQMLTDTLHANGVSFKGITIETIPTGIAMITVVNGNNFIILDAGANYALTPEIIEQHSGIIAQSDFCVLQLEIPLESVLKVCEIASQNNTLIILNPAPFQPLPDILLSQIDYLIPNEHEAQDLTGINPNTEENCKEAIRMLQQKGIPNIIITLGERGCVYNRGDEIIFNPAIPTNAIDTTSAGDCFIGALVAKISQNETLEHAVSYATKASAIAVSREGASKSIPYANELE